MNQDIFELSEKCKTIVDRIRKTSKDSNSFLLSVLDEIWSISREREDQFIVELISQTCTIFQSSFQHDEDPDDLSEDSDSSDRSFNEHLKSHKIKESFESLEVMQNHIVTFPGVPKKELSLAESKK